VDRTASALGTLEQAFAAAQRRLLHEQQQLTALNVRLLDLSGKISGDEATIDQAKHQLSALARQSYENTTSDTWVAAVLSATTFAQAIERLNGTAHVAVDVRTVEVGVRQKEQAIVDEQAAIGQDIASSTAAEHQFAQDSNALLVLVEQRNVALQGASAPTRSLVAQIAIIDEQIAALSSPVAPRAGTSAPCGDHFAYGQCTWRGMALKAVASPLGPKVQRGQDLWP
jgi:peptidoglycan hydrolase CwlO-like protein